MADMPQASAEGAKPIGNASQIVSGVHTGLMELMDLFNQSKAMTPKDKQLLSQIVSLFQKLVEGLGQVEGQDPDQELEASGPVPMMAGVANAKPAL